MRWNIFMPAAFALAAPAIASPEWSMRVPAPGFIVAFAGSQDLFAEQVAFRRVPTPADVQFAAAILQKVGLCRAGSKTTGCADGR
jgi:hypothetical protein